MSPACLATVLGALSTFQLFIPMVFSTRWFFGNNEKPRSENVLEKVDLHTPIIHRWFFQHPIEITPSQELATLAVACGLRYTSSMSISYPNSVINDIIQFKQGFTLSTPTGLEVMSQGWEMRALRTFRAFQMTISQRMLYVLLFKLAFQMNLQITFFGIRRSRESPGYSFYHQLFTLTLRPPDVVMVVSILGLLVTTLCEFIDGFLLIKAFRKLRLEVLQNVTEIQEDQHYAVEDTGADGQKKYQGRQLKAEYRVVKCNIIAMALLITISAGFIVYGVLKFVKSGACPYGLWQFYKGCLPKKPDHWECQDK